MNLYFSTVVRTAPPEQGGELVHLDWDRKQVLARTPIVPTDPWVDDPNPRGNSRGGRGIALVDDSVIVASYHTLKVFDADLRHRTDISHPHFVGLHEIQPTTHGTLWVTATALDAAFEMSLPDGRMIREIWPREMPSFQRSLPCRPLTVDKRQDLRNHPALLVPRSSVPPADKGLHLNAAVPWRGNMLAIFNSRAVLANLDSGEVLISDPRLEGAHNIVIADDRLAYVNGTTVREVLEIDLEQRRIARTFSLLAYPRVRSLIPFYGLRRNPFLYRLRRTVGRFLLPRLQRPVAAAPFFARGLDLVGDLLFVGISPASILCIDRRSGALLDLFNYSLDVRVCIHGLRVAPARSAKDESSMRPAQQA